MSQENHDSAKKPAEPTPSPHDAQKSSAPAGNKPRSIQQWEDLVSGRIEEAMQQGAFDNLPGHGKPLNLRRNPYTPEDQQMAFNILEDNNLTPDWIGDRRQLQADIAALRKQIEETVAKNQAGLRDASSSKRAELYNERQYYLRRWQEAVDLLNKRIRTINLKQPFVHLEIFTLKLSEELARLGANWLDEKSE